MGKLTKNQKLAAAKIDTAKSYPLTEAVELLKEITFTKFDASVDIDVRLGVDHRHQNTGQNKNDRMVQFEFQGISLLYIGWIYCSTAKGP